MNEARYLMMGIVLGVFMCRYIFPIFGKIIVNAAKHLKKQKHPKSTKNDLMAMPKEWIGQIHNACVDPCDMLCGPCACGAWHHFEEWIIIRKKLTTKGWVDPRIKN